MVLDFESVVNRQKITSAQTYLYLLSSGEYLALALNIT